MGQDSPDGGKVEQPASSDTQAGQSTLVTFRFQPGCWQAKLAGQLVQSDQVVLVFIRINHAPDFSRAGGGYVGVYVGVFVGA